MQSAAIHCWSWKLPRALGACRREDDIIADDRSSPASVFPKFPGLVDPDQHARCLHMLCSETSIEPLGSLAGRRSHTSIIEGGRAASCCCWVSHRWASHGCTLR